MSKIEEALKKSQTNGLGRLLQADKVVAAVGQFHLHLKSAGQTQALNRRQHKHQL